jgi:protoheme IX farnesyltransferase
MKAATLLPEAAVPAMPALAPGRLADYVALAKPRVAVLVLFVVAAGVLLAAGNDLQPLVLLHTLVGTALVAAGASALNQWIERHSDACMSRTENRPLPSGRLLPGEVLVLGLVLGAAGLSYLALALPRPGAALVAGLTFVSYVGIYTPLKRVTPLNTLVGAVPGALPPLIGWCAVRGDVPFEAVLLFVLLFLWQIPHFLAIAWMYREQYARAGLVMLPVVDRGGERTSQQMIAYCLALLAVSLVPTLIGAAGVFYLAGAVLLGLAFLGSTLAFQRRRSLRQARLVLRTSLVYLPGLFALLLMDRALSWLFVAA